MNKLITLLLALVAAPAWALPIAFEPFDYPYSPPSTSTNLVGHSNVDGLTWSQAGPATNNVPSVWPGSLTYTGLAAGYGNSCLFGGLASGGGSGMAARLSLPSNVTGGSLYYSFILKVTDITALSSAANGVFWAGFNNTPGAQGGLPTIVFTAVVTKTNATGGYLIGVDKRGGDTNSLPFDPAPHQVGDVLFVVGSYDYLDGGPGSGSGDTSRMWINPDPSTFGGTAPAALLTSTGAQDVTLANGGIQSFCLFNRNAGEPHGIIVDQLIIGTSWADVTPTNVPLAIVAQPKNQRAVAGGNASFTVSTFNASQFQWQHNGVNITGATQRTLALTNVQTGDAGSYLVKVSNSGGGPLASSNATLLVFPDIYPRLSPLWSVAANTRPYLTIDNSTQPNVRCFAYNAFSNQVLLVSRTNSNFNGITNASVYVLDGTSGTDLYQMGNDPTVITGGLDVNGGGTNIITLNCIDVADDGAVYAANVGNSGTGTAQFKVYRWDSSGQNAAGPTNIWIGDPSLQASAPRFGDSLAVRGSADATQIMLDDQSGRFGAVLAMTPGGSPSDPNAWELGPFGWFTNVAAGQTGGRTLKFFGSTNTFWEKHGSGNLNLLTYDKTAGVTSSSIITNFPNVLNGPSLVDFNSTTNLLFAIDFASSTNVSDTLDQYDLSDPSNPLFVRSYNFPILHQANGNGCGRVVVSGDRVYALDSNNGFVAFQIVPNLSIMSSGGNVVVAWPATTPGYTLKATPSLQAPVNWTNVGTGTLVGQQYFVTNAPSAGSLFYRLQK